MMDGIWIGFDLDGTLAIHGTGDDPIGEPIPGAVALFKAFLKQDYELRIFTARVSVPQIAERQRKLIQEWCEKHIGYIPEVTCIKDMGMIYCIDDRSVQMLTNNGILVTKNGCFKAEEIAHDLPSLLKSSRKQQEPDQTDSPAQ